MPRGEHVLEGVEIEVSDFFGWIRKTSFHPTEKYSFCVSENDGYSLCTY